MMYPWLEDPFKRFVNRISKLPQGMLITGPKGIGKLLFSSEIARSFLCETSENTPGCSECQSCYLFAAGNHPDYHLLTNEQTFQTGEPCLVGSGERYLNQIEGRTNERSRPKSAIGVNQVRALTEELRATPHFTQGKVIVIYPADELNLNASNALLKALEEPTPNTIFFLVTDSIYALPATIRSRCSDYRLPFPPEEDALAWLQKKLSLGGKELKELLDLANGSPLEAYELSEGEAWGVAASLPNDLAEIIAGKTTPVDIVKKWGQTDIRTIVRRLQREMLNAFRAGVGAGALGISGQVYDHLGRDRCLALYKQAGDFLKWPQKAIDETLFLESIILSLFDHTRRGRSFDIDP